MTNKTFIISEIGINHNGDIQTAKNLIDMAVRCGSDAVKFQKRDVETVYTKEELDKLRESPWGTTQRQQKPNKNNLNNYMCYCSSCVCNIC